MQLREPPFKFGVLGAGWLRWFQKCHPKVSLWGVGFGKSKRFISISYCYFLWQLRAYARSGLWARLHMELWWIGCTGQSKWWEKGFLWEIKPNGMVEEASPWIIEHGECRSCQPWQGLRQPSHSIDSVSQNFLLAMPQPLPSFIGSLTLFGPIGRLAPCLASCHSSSAPSLPTSWPPIPQSW